MPFSSTPPPPAPLSRYISSAGTTVVKPSAGILYSILVTSPFANGTATAYKSNGTLTDPISGFGPNVVQSCHYGPRGLDCAAGITIDATAGFDGQITVIYE